MHRPNGLMKIGIPRADKKLYARKAMASFK